MKSNQLLLAPSHSQYSGKYIHNPHFWIILPKIRPIKNNLPDRRRSGRNLADGHAIPGSGLLLKTWQTPTLDFRKQERQLRTGSTGGCLRSIAQRTRSGACSYWIGQQQKMAKKQAVIFPEECSSAFKADSKERNMIILHKSTGSDTLPSQELFQIHWVSKNVPPFHLL